MPEETATAPARNMMSRFQSLGDNCEFGFVQRHFGYEPIGLFRFNWIGMEALLRGIDTRFEGVGDQTNLSIHADQAGELIIQDKTYGFSTHTGRYEGQIDRAKLMTLESTRLTFLARKFFEDLVEGGTIFVRKGDGSATYRDIRPLHERLQSIGPNMLLWVVLSNDTHPAGSVERLETDLLKGHISRFAQYGFAQDFLPEEWAALCENACQAAGKPWSMSQAC